MRNEVVKFTPPPWRKFRRHRHAGDGPVVISDTDPQGTAADWFNQRKRSGIDTPLYSPLTLADLREKTVALGEAGASYLFIDTAPSIGSVNAELFDLADVILIPLNPTPADLRALVKGLSLIKQSGKPFYFILSRVRPTCGTMTAPRWPLKPWAWCCRRGCMSA